MAINHRGYQVACRTKALTLSVATTTPFARASTATYTDVNGIVQTAPINVLRNAHYVNGVLQPPLIEGAATNQCRFSSDATNPAWTKISCTPTLMVGPDSQAGSATLLTTTATPAMAYIIGAACNAGTTQSISGFLKQGSTGWAWIGDDRDAVFHRAWINLATGAVGTVAGCVCTTELLLTGWIRWQITFTTTNAITPRLNVSPASANGSTVSTPGDTLGISIHQHELNAIAASSPIVTGNTTITRAADIDQMFSATASGYSRQTGSFLTEGFAPGMEIAPNGYASNPVDTLTDVSALTLTTKSPRTVESALAGRSFSVGLPLARAWENKKPPADPPVQGIPFVKEQYIPGPPAQQVTVGPFGDVELMPMYALHIHVPANYGFEAASAYADAIMRLFTPRTAMAVGSEFLRVHTRGPFRGQLLNSAPGFAVVPITAPLYIRTPNSI